jgi:hypothetical protein
MYCSYEGDEQSPEMDMLQQQYTSFIANEPAQAVSFTMDGAPMEVHGQQQQQQQQWNHHLNLWQDINTRIARIEDILNNVSVPNIK